MNSAEKSSNIAMLVILVLVCLVIVLSLISIVRLKNNENTCKYISSHQLSTSSSTSTASPSLSAYPKVSLKKLRMTSFIEKNMEIIFFVLLGY